MFENVLLVTYLIQFLFSILVLHVILITCYYIKQGLAIKLFFVWFLGKYKPGKVRMLKGEFFHYSGNCNSSDAARDEIRNNFVQALNASLYSAACFGVPECDAKNVNVTCGPTSARRRREVDSARDQHAIAKRQTQP